MDSNLNIEQMRETSNQGPHPRGSAINPATLTPSSGISAQRQGLSIPLPGPRLTRRSLYGGMGVSGGGVRRSLQAQTDYNPTDQ